MHSDSSLTYAQIYCKNINKLIAGAKSEYAAFEILDTEIARLQCYLDEEVRELRDVYEALAEAESTLEIRDSRIKELEFALTPLAFFASGMPEARIGEPDWRAMSKEADKILQKPL